MDDHLVHTTPNHHAPSQNGCSSKNFCSNQLCCYMASAALKYVPQTGATTFAFSSVCFFFSGPDIIIPSIPNKTESLSPKATEKTCKIFRMISNYRYAKHLHPKWVFLRQILAVFIFYFSSLLVCFLGYFPVYVYNRLDRDYLPIILFQQRIICIACYLTVLFSSSLFTAQ